MFVFPIGGYKHVGCFKDNIFDRAVPELDGKYETLKDSYKDRANAIHKCYEVAKKQGISFQYFYIKSLYLNYF